MRVSDIVEFSKDKFYNGAVQTEWFYDKDRRDGIASSYVFHGPKYYGISSADIKSTTHQLIDTASFARAIAERLYEAKTANPFLMTIAGYGTGKSHLAVCLGTLFCSNTGAVQQQIIANISSVDSGIGEYIQKIHTKENLVIALNGMSNFNLDAEILSLVRSSLHADGLDDSVLYEITRAYDIAKHFVERTFPIYAKEFEKSASNVGIREKGEELKRFLVEQVESNAAALSVINQVYQDVNGDTIHWDRGISSGDILKTISAKLCGEGKPYNKILILFDEFGRFIEYAAANPDVAGEASLQQMFEAVQDANGAIIFAGFIQSDLSAYLSRIDKTANIVRYVGRYENSDKFYLSNNFETILANLLRKTDDAKFNKAVNPSFNRYERYYSRIMSSLTRWDKSAQKKSVWSSKQLYENVILRGCFPFHPITVWFLSNTSSWMQQRSTIAFVAEMYQSIRNSEINEDWLPYIYPVDIVESSIYHEMLNSEEKGLVQSQFCMLYRDIIVKNRNKFTPSELTVLKSVLILNMCRFSFVDKLDAIKAIQYCSPLTENEVSSALVSLEQMYAVISFDDNAKVFDFIAEANGLNEFKRVFQRYALGVQADINDCDETTLMELSLTSPVDTSFAQEHHISSTEWCFKQALVSSDNITEAYISSRLNELSMAYTGEEPRGLLLYAYCNKNADTEIDRLSKLHSKLSLEKSSILIFFIDDAESVITTSLRALKVLNKFSVSDSNRFSKFVVGQSNSYKKKLSKDFAALASKRQMIVSDGIKNYEGRKSQICSQRFNELFTSAPPFAFDGFEKKTSLQAKKYLSNICKKLYDRSLMNVQSYQALTQDEKNRVRACLAVGVRTSWQVFDNDLGLIPPRNPILADIFRGIYDKLSPDEPKPLFSLIKEYLAAPYGMNANSISMFLMYFLSYHENGVRCYYDQEKLLPSHLSEKIFRQDKLNIRELLKIRIGKNENADIDVVAQFCKAALTCQDVSRCEDLLKQINDLVAVEGTTSDNQLIVSMTRSQLSKGAKIHSIQLETLSRLSNLVDDSMVSRSLNQFIREAFKDSFDVNGIIEEGYPFIYEKSYIDSLKDYKHKIDKILSEKYLTKLLRTSCKVTQLSSFVSTYKKVSATLRSNGYNQLADATDARMEEVSNDCKIQQKYETIFAEIEKDVAMYSNVSKYSYSEASDYIVKLKNWDKLFTSAQDIPKTMGNQYKQRIQDGINSLKSRQQDIVSYVEMLLQKEQTANSVRDIIKLEHNLNSLDTSEFPNDLLSAIQQMRERIEIARSSIVSLPTQIDALKQVAIPQGSPFYSALVAEKQRLLSRYFEDEKAWLKEFVDPMEKQLSQGMLKAVTCSNWLSKTEILPDYLSDEAKSTYEQVRLQIENQLHKSRVQGVVTLFNSLSMAEKEDCLRMLNELFSAN